VENFRSSNAFLVEPPHFNAALVGMQMTAGVRVGRVASTDVGEPAEAPSGDVGEVVAGPSRDAPTASTSEGVGVVCDVKHPTSASGGADAGGDARRVTFTSPGEDGVSVHASDQELSSDGSSSSDEVSDSADVTVVAAAGAGSPGEAPGRVQRAVEKLEGGVTSETCRVTYRGAGTPATQEPPREAAEGDEAGRSRARKRPEPGDSRRAASASRTGAKRSRPAEASGAPRTARAASAAPVPAMVAAAPAAVPLSHPFGYGPVVAHQGYGQYVPAFCPPPPYPGSLEIGRAVDGSHGAGGQAVVGGAGALAPDARPDVAPAADHRGGASAERRRRRRRRNRRSRSPVRPRSRSPRWRNPWRR
jgi:hypothetical protein